MRPCINLNRRAVYRHATHFLGYGNPHNAKVWFVGLEDVRTVRSRSQLRSMPTRINLYRSDLGESSPSVYTVISKIIMRLKGDKRSTAWREYKIGHLFQPDGDALLANLYPLGKRVEQDWPHAYREWLDMTADQYYGWIQSSELPRFEFLKRCRSQFSEPLTICFGKNHWRHFIRCFAGEEDPVIDFGRFRFIPLRKLILTEFFRSTRMPDTSINDLVNSINGLSMNPFQCRRSRKRSGGQQTASRGRADRRGPRAGEPRLSPEGMKEGIPWVIGR